MKSIITVLLGAIVMLGSIATPAEGQTHQNPNNVPPYFWYGGTPANNQVWRGKIDTLSTVKLGAANTLSFVITSSDTMKAHLYVDYLMRGRTTWSVAYTDSFIAVKDTVFEYVLRSPTIDRIGGFASSLRLRVSQHSAATPSDFDSSSTYTQTWIWKP